MSAIIIACIQASIEIPKVPPCSFEQGSAVAREPSISPLPDPTPTIPSRALEAIDPATAGIESGLEDPAQASEAIELLGEIVPSALVHDPDLWLYRRRTVGLLRRYLRLSIEVGRMPSLLGREIFRAQLTAYKSSTFEDSVIFVHDVEHTLDRLHDFHRQLIAKVVLQEYSQEEAARLLGCTHRHAARVYVEALDRVSELFLERGLLTRLPETKSVDPKKPCQGGQRPQFPLSDSEET